MNPLNDWLENLLTQINGLFDDDDDDDDATKYRRLYRMNRMNVF